MNTAPQQLEGADGTINGKLAPAVISNTAQSNGRPNQYASNINPTGRGATYPNNNRVNPTVTNRGGGSTQHRAGNWNASSRVGGQGYEGKQQFTSAVQANGDPTVNGGSLYQPVIPGAAQRNAPIRVQSAPPNLAEQQAAQTPVPVETNIPLDTQQMPQSQFIPHKTMLYAAPNMNYYPYAPPFMYPPYPMPAGRGVPTQPMPGAQLRPQQVMPQPTQPGQQAPPGSVPVQQPRYHPHSMGQAGQLLGMPPSYISNRGVPMGTQPQQRQPVYPGQPYMNPQQYQPPPPNVVTNVIPPPQQGKKRIEIRDPHTKELINMAGLKTASTPTETTEEQHPVQPVAAAFPPQASIEKPEPTGTNAITNDPTIPGSAKKPETEPTPARKAIVLQNPVSRETIELGPAHKSTPPALKPLHAEASDNKDQTARNDAEPHSHGKTLVEKTSNIETTKSSPQEVNNVHPANIDGGEGNITHPQEAEPNGVAALVEHPIQESEEESKDKSGDATSNGEPSTAITAIPTDDSFANSEDASLHITESDQVNDSLDIEAANHSFDEQDGESSIFSDNAESNDPEDWELKDDDELTNIKGNKQVVQKPTQLVSEKSSDGFQIRQYDRNFMLSFQDRFKQKPDGMALIDDVINTGLDGGGRGERSNLMMSGGSQSYRKGGSQSRSQMQGGFNRPVAQKIGSMNMGSKSGSLRRSSGSNRNLKPKTPPPSSTVPVAPLIPSKDRWVPSKARQITESEVVVRKVMGLLNKITVETFASISDQIISSGITSSEILRSVIQQVYEKAVSEPHFSTLYATLCRKLAAKTKMFEEAGEKTTFKRILLNRCQEEFEKKQDISQLSGLSEIERAEADMKMRKRMKGNVKFIGELFKQKMLSEQIMHECILRLVGNVNAPVPADIEALCKLLTTIGGLIDHQEAKPKLDALFVQLNQLSNSTVLEPRVCFMLKDVIELRERNWIPRREEAKPTTIKEVRTQAMDKDLQDSRVSGKPGSGTLTPQKILSNPNVRSSSGRSSPPLTQTQQPSANEWAIAGGGKSRSGKTDSKNASSKYQQNQSSTTPLVLGPRSSNSMVSGAAGWNQKGGASAGGSATSGGRGGSSSNAAGAGSSSNAKLAPGGGGNRFQALAGASGTSPEKKPSKPIISKEKLEEDTISLLEEFLVNDDLEEAIACTRELVECCLPDMIGDIIFHTISFALEKKENDVFKCAEYVSNTMKKGVVSVKSFLQGVSQMIEIFEDIAVDIPTAPKSLGIVLGSAVDTESLRLADAFELLKPLNEKSPAIKADYGMAERIVGELLQSLSLAMEKQELKDMYSSSQFDIKDLFRSKQRNEDHLQEFATRNNISFLFPLLGVTKEIGAKLKEGVVDIDSFMVWVKANIPAPVARKNPNFVSQVFKMVLDSTSTPEGSVDIKTQLTSIKKLTPFLQHLLNGNIAAQVSAVFLLQAHWATHKSQPAALKQMFHFFYQQEIISEEAFDQWTNDTRDVGEQKQHALLDVNPFLTWLETAEEEEEEEEEEEKKSSPAQ